VALFFRSSSKYFFTVKTFNMKSLMNIAVIGLLLLGTTAYAGNGKVKTPKKKAQTTQTCGPNCPHPCPPTCPPGCCPKKG
jgi:hypothetical protein